MRQKLKTGNSLYSTLQCGRFRLHVPTSACSDRRQGVHMLATCRLLGAMGGQVATDSLRSAVSRACKQSSHLCSAWITSSKAGLAHACHKQ